MELSISSDRACNKITEREKDKKISVFIYGIDNVRIIVDHDDLDQNHRICLRWSSGGFVPFVGTATVVARHEFTS